MPIFTTNSISASWIPDPVSTGSTSSIDSSVVWGSWVRGSNSLTVDTSSTYSPCNTVWAAWNRIQTTSAIDTFYQEAPDNVVWRMWNHGYVPTQAQVYGFPAVHAALTPEQRAQREAEQALLQQQREAADAERKQAKVNAEKLLLSVLNEDQKRDWVAQGHFCLFVGDKKYRIKRGRSGNVELLDPRTNEILERYCAHPVQAVPDEDTAVAQMMYLKHDELRFIGLANVHYTKPGFQSQKRLLAA